MNARKSVLAAVAVVACCAPLAVPLASADAASKRPGVRVGPNDPPIGATLDTLGADGAITIAGQAYGANGGFWSAYVVLARTSREVVESGDVYLGPDGVRTLQGIADKYSGGSNYLKYLMIISGRYGPNGDPGAFFKLLKQLGSPVLTPSQSYLLGVDRSPFSVIGIPGAPAGAATVRVGGLVGGTTRLSGAITGYLQRNQAISIDGTPLYDYVSTEHPPFDTRAAGWGATKNVMTVNGQSYESSIAPLAGATAGLHVVILDSLTLRVLRNEALVTNSTGQSYTDRQLQTGAAGFLRQWFNNPSQRRDPAPPQVSDPDVIVLVQTIGKPKAAGPEWGTIVGQLARLGANRLYVNALDGTNEYSIVGGLNSDLPPAEASTAYDHGPYPAPYNPPARIVGVLARTRTATFAPTVSSTPTGSNPAGAVNLELIKVAYQPLERWPVLAKDDPPDEASSAEHYICGQLNFCQASDSCPDLRSCYWQKYNSNWGLKHSILGAMGYPGPSSGFSEKTFSDVKRELLPEVAAVANVQDYLNKVQLPFDRSETRSYVDLQRIGQGIYDALQPPPLDNSTSWTLGLISKATAIGGRAPPPFGGGAAAISAVFGLAAYLSDKQGQPILGTEIKTKTSDLAGELLDRFDLARKELVGLGLLILSDHDKLMDANRHIDSDWSLPADPSVTVDQLRTAAQQWFYEALMPVAYPYLIRGNAANAQSLDCRGAGRDGWPNQPDNDQMLATVGYDGGGNPIKAIFFYTRGIFGGSSPPAGFGDKMFAPRNAAPPGLGIEKLSFFTPSVFNGGVIHAINHTFDCSVSWLPWHT